MNFIEVAITAAMILFSVAVFFLWMRWEQNAHAKETKESIERQNQVLGRIADALDNQAARERDFAENQRNIVNALQSLEKQIADGESRSAREHEGLMKKMESGFEKAESLARDLDDKHRVDHKAIEKELAGFAGKK